jgi:hypothetical protein
MISRVPSSRWLIAGDHAARVADHVRLAFGQAEQAVHVEPGVHAGDHGQLAGWRERQQPAKLRRVRLVVGQQLISSSHDASPPRFWPR